MGKEMKLDTLLEGKTKQFFDKPAPSKIKLLDTLTAEEFVAHRQVILNILSNTLNLADVELFMARVRGDDSHGENFEFEMKMAEKLLKTIPGIQDVRINNHDRDKNPRFSFLVGKLYGREHGKPMDWSRINGTNDTRIGPGTASVYLTIHISRKGTTWKGQITGCDSYSGIPKASSASAENLVDMFEKLQKNIAIARKKFSI